MGGAEVARLLEKACQDAGLSPALTGHVLLCFSIRWGEQITQDMDIALFEAELKGLENGSG